MDRQAQREGGLFRFNIDRRLREEATRPKWWEKKTKRRLETHEDWQEWQAQYFASEILMPHRSVRSEFERRFNAAEVLTPARCSQCEFADELAGETFFSDGVIRRSLHEVFAVSRQAMAIRLCELGLVQIV